jgi:hypothetical protein
VTEPAHPHHRRLLIDVGRVEDAETVATMLARAPGAVIARTGSAVLISGPAEGVEDLRRLIEAIAWSCGWTVRVLEV